jgi:hypothetical protein
LVFWFFGFSGVLLFFQGVHVFWALYRIIWILPLKADILDINIHATRWKLGAGMNGRIFCFARVSHDMQISSFLNITLNFVLYYTNTYTLHLNTTYQSDTMNESMFGFDLIENFNTFQAFNFFCHFEI